MDLWENILVETNCVLRICALQWMVINPQEENKFRKSKPARKKQSRNRCVNDAISDTWTAGAKICWRPSDSTTERLCKLEWSLTISTNRHPPTNKYTNKAKMMCVPNKWSFKICSIYPFQLNYGSLALPIRNSGGPQCELQITKAASHPNLRHLSPSICTHLLIFSSSWIHWSVPCTAVNHWTNWLNE